MLPWLPTYCRAVVDAGLADRLLKKSLFSAVPSGARLVVPPMKLAVAPALRLSTPALNVEVAPPTGVAGKPMLTVDWPPARARPAIVSLLLTAKPFWAA